MKLKLARFPSVTKPLTHCPLKKFSYLKFLYTNRIPTLLAKGSLVLIGILYCFALVLTVSCSCSCYLLQYMTELWLPCIPALSYSHHTIGWLITGEVDRVLNLSFKPNTLETHTQKIDSHVASCLKTDFKFGNSEKGSTFFKTH